MKITEVTIRKTTEEGKLKAYANVTFDNCFVISGLKIMNGSKGLFVSMPNRKMPNGEYKDICFPITAEFRLEVINSVMDKYNGDNKSDDEEGLPDWMRS